MVEEKLQSFQVDTGAPVTTLVVEPQSTPDDTVKVSAGNVFLDDDITMVPFAGGNSASLGALTATFQSRWDLILLDVTGASAVLAVTTGVESMSAQPFGTGLPTVPVGHILLAAVQVTEATPSAVVISSADIVDARGFFHRVQTGGAAGPYNPTTSADWVSVPSFISPALDELANRLNSGTSGLGLGTADPGSSKIASRNDHVHPHGSLVTDVGTLMHDASQMDHAGVLADWVGGATDRVDDRLDEVGKEKMWVREASSFASLQAAIIDFEASPKAFGILVADGGTLTLSGSTTLTKPLRIVANNSAGAAQISLVSGVLTLDFGAAASFSYITFEGVDFIRSAAQTGRIATADSGHITLRDVTFGITGTDTTAIFTLSKGYVVEAHRCDLALATVAGTVFDLTATGAGSFDIHLYHTKSINTVSGADDRTFKLAAAEETNFFLNDYSVVMTNILIPNPGASNLHYDGTSLWVQNNSADNPAFVSICGNAFYCDRHRVFAASSDVVNVGRVFGNFAGNKLIISGETHAFDIAGASGISFPIRDGVIIEGEGGSSSTAAKTTITGTTPAAGSALIIPAARSDCTIRNISFRATLTSASVPLLRNDGTRTLFENLDVTATGGTWNRAIEMGGGGPSLPGSRAVGCKCFHSGGTFSTGMATFDGSTLENCFIGEFLSTGITANSPGDVVKNCRVRLDSATSGAIVGILLTAGSKAVNCLVYMNAAPVGTVAFGIEIRGAVAASEDPGAICKGCTVKGDTDGSVKTIVSGIEISNEGCVVGDNIVTRCTSDAIKLTITAIGNAVGINVTRFNGGKGINDLGSNNAFTGNVSDNDTGTNTYGTGSLNTGNKEF